MAIVGELKAFLMLPGMRRDRAGPGQEAPILREPSLTPREAWASHPA